MWPWLGVPWGQRYQVTFEGQRIGHVAHNLNEITILTPAPRLYLNRWVLASHTFCWGRGAYRPPVISQTTGPISKIQLPFDIPVRELSEDGVKYDPDVTDDVTDRIRVGMFDISDFVTSASKISMWSANKATLQMSLTFVIISSCALWPYYGSRSSPVTM